ncbi:MAG: hypothetical protein IJC94_02170 [Oscillospiraceae bacterium]|nr:hypothetical protein [Oscillospiraceae bacterium]
MISDLALIIFIVAILSLIVFFIWSRRVTKKRMLLHKLFVGVGISYIAWIIPIIIMRFVPTDNRYLIYLLDCAVQPGGAFCSPLFACMAVTFVTGEEKLNKWLKAVFILPVVSILVVWTNPLHHLYYRNFSVIRSEIEFGPYVLVTGLGNYLFLLVPIIYMIRFGVKNKNPLYWRQAAMFIISAVVPLIVSVYSTFGNDEAVSIATTPLSFIVTLVFNGIAIFQLHMLDITPIATEHILNAISDSYLVLSDSGVIVKYNRSFGEMFGKIYGIQENRNILECVQYEDKLQKNPFYNLVAALESSRQGDGHVSYEQAITLDVDGELIKKCFVVDVSPLQINGQISGFVALFKDITQLRDSMKKLQQSQERMMEQERFVFLGQMIGGLAHNLKTPIMSISGCVSAAEALVDECEESIGDADVTEDDFREIYQEMRGWFGKIRESSSYMSDIITAIKGQATNIVTDEKVTFTIDEMLKRSVLLMRHELLNSRCNLKIDYDKTEEISLEGDINNLVQVVGNLLSNAIYAQKEKGGGEIEISVFLDEQKLNILVKDRGTGINERVLPKLFKMMVTSKGTQGTGLGLYFSNIVIRGKFNGQMWGENRADGGSIFGISIPREIVHVRKELIVEGEK